MSFDELSWIRKIVNIFYPSVLAYVLGAQKNRLNVRVPTINVWLKIKKINFWYALKTWILSSFLSKSMGQVRAIPEKKYLGGEEGKRYIFLWVVGADIFQIIWVIGV